MWNCVQIPTNRCIADNLANRNIIIWYLLLHIVASTYFVYILIYKYVYIIVRMYKYLPAINKIRCVHDIFTKDF